MTDLKELSVTRLIDAPRPVVYRVWTERLGEWWAPRPGSTPVVEIDFRAGGRCYTEMEFDGRRMPNEGVVLEVVPEEKVVFTDAFGPGWVPSGPFMVAIFTFADEGGKTRYTGTVRHWTDEALKQHEEMGFEQGWGMVADQFSTLCEEAAATV